ncbi:RNA polymerase sigma factor [Paenibacillus sp. HJGM_3]|uniref:RNA polymerase sigma factor n=1 Tax=Paenibacillus sp. HJGM_3 TaxID=3379816 RepID=UPI0038585133
MYERNEDIFLVAQAKDGDGNAFEELVRRHRSKAYLWAKGVVGDPHLAEDVVQEAIMKSFLRIGTLANISRFLPWLHQIVRNQALRSVRRGGPYRKEWPISDFLPLSREEQLRMESPRAAWPAMTPSAHALSSREGDPCELLLRREVLTTISSMVKQLSPAERAVFEAHFYQELTAQEISRHLSLSTASVYMSLSRSRKKLQSGGAFSMQSSKRAVLSKPGILHSRTGLYNESIRNCIYHALPYVGKGHLGYDEVMALTGHAWQINLKKRTIDLSSVYMYMGTTLFPNSMLNLGLHSSLIDKFGYERMPEGLLKEELYTLTLDMIRGSIDRGVPAIFSGGVNTQFALYHGYDDGRQIFYAMDTITEMEIPYLTFRNRHLYGFVIEESAAIDELERLRRMLTMAVKHGRGEEATFSGYANGLRAYDYWVEAWENGRADPAGHAACVRNVGDMRSYAASYLRKQRLGWEEKAPSETEMIGLFAEAADRYEEVAQAFRHLKGLLPAHATIQWLRQAQSAESQGLFALECILNRLNADGNVPRLIEPNPMWIL